ncbi:2Fe-2S iron-sulfur cluster binding domain-containing protein [Kaustia mangrovi]|uniref:2Fe-2S iron-sulfur cluster binding domain-containing protein n=1 Tax=Kaustia mangrovi TaxID=2593653 RepID=A0A7S8C284_9HYPH|nr:2Fe-2S iron-sulfur cluster-binding protein [Kaustia mangrovi]QPC42024.1 2Fe-2S iron-sulfur cluster binding domain-containing protein [Kaustia mangrovi]
MAFTLIVNGESHTVRAAGDTPLLWVLRDELALTGTKYGCDSGLCGICMVHVDGETRPSCAMTLAEAAGRSVTTIEGLHGPLAETLRAAWRELEVSQCGYCQTGQIMAAAALLAASPAPDDAQIDRVMDAVVCRCAAYRRIRAAIYRTSRPGGEP